VCDDGEASNGSATAFFLIEVNFLGLLNRGRLDPGKQWGTAARELIVRRSLKKATDCSTTKRPWCNRVAMVDPLLLGKSTAKPLSEIRVDFVGPAAVTAPSADGSPGGHALEQQPQGLNDSQIEKLQR